jgi:hypothetical protein
LANEEVSVNIYDSQGSWLGLNYSDLMLVAIHRDEISQGRIEAGFTEDELVAALESNLPRLKEAVASELGVLDNTKRLYDATESNELSQTADVTSPHRARRRRTKKPVCQDAPRRAKRRRASSHKRAETVTMV